MRACFCVGPKNGQPLCPCAMRNVSVENGRYVQKIDHEPVAEKKKSVSDFRTYRASLRKDAEDLKTR